MNKLVETLMRRDNMTEQEAVCLVNDVRERMLENPNEAEDIMLSDLGLEMDYIFDIL